MKGYRTVSVIWEDTEGKTLLFSFGATYKLMATEFSQTNIFTIYYDGKEINHNFSSQIGTSPVTREDGRIQFKLSDEPSVIIEGNKVTAAMEGEFVGIREKVG